MEQTQLLGSLVLGLGALIGLFITVGKPINNLTNTLTRFEGQLNSLLNDLEEHKDKTKESNNRIYNRLDVHDNKFNDHEIRLTKLEK